MVFLYSERTHKSNMAPDINVTPLGPNVFGVTVTPTGTYDKPDWSTSKKTNVQGISGLLSL
jgi:hypothetical protein